MNKKILLSIVYMLPCMFCDCMRQNDSFNKFIQPLIRTDQRPGFAAYKEAIGGMLYYIEDELIKISGCETSQYQENRIQKRKKAIEYCDDVIKDWQNHAQGQKKVYDDYQRALAQSVTYYTPNSYKSTSVGLPHAFGKHMDYFSPGQPDKKIGNALNAYDYINEDDILFGYRQKIVGNATDSLDKLYVMPLIMELLAVADLLSKSRQIARGEYKKTIRGNDCAFTGVAFEISGIKYNSGIEPKFLFFPVRHPNKKKSAQVVSFYALNGYGALQYKFIDRNTNSALNKSCITFADNEFKNLFEIAPITNTKTDDVQHGLLVKDDMKKVQEISTVYKTRYTIIKSNEYKLKINNQVYSFEPCLGYVGNAYTAVQNSIVIYKSFVSIIRDLHAAIPVSFKCEERDRYKKAQYRFDTFGTVCSRACDILASKDVVDNDLTYMLIHTADFAWDEWNKLFKSASPYPKLEIVNPVCFIFSRLSNDVGLKGFIELFYNLINDEFFKNIDVNLNMTTGSVRKICMAKSKYFHSLVHNAAISIRNQSVPMLRIRAKVTDYLTYHFDIISLTANLDVFYISTMNASENEKKKKSELLVNRQNRYNQKFDNLISYAKDVACVILENRQDVDKNFAYTASDIVRLSSEMVSHYKNACDEFCSGKYDEGDKERKNGIEKARKIDENLAKNF